jgi:hypothetical protein
VSAIASLLYTSSLKYGECGGGRMPDFGVS